MKEDFQICPVCEVKIEKDDKVVFSFGPPGSRARLYARVCQFAKKEGCINKNINPNSLKEEDLFGTDEIREKAESSRLELEKKFNNNEIITSKQVKNPYGR